MSDPSAESEPMGPIARGVLVIVGAGSMGTMGLAWLQGAHAGPSSAFGLGLTIAIGWLAFSTGLLAGANAKTRRNTQVAGAVLIVLGCGLAGPSASESYQRSQEEQAYEALNDATIDVEAGLQMYEEKVDPKFRRERWRSVWMSAKVDRAIASGNPATVQQVIDEIDRVGGPGSGAARARASTYLKPARADGDSPTGMQ